LRTTVANDCEEEDLCGIVRFLTRVAMAPFGGDDVATADLSGTKRKGADVFPFCSRLACRLALRLYPEDLTQTMRRALLDQPA
jgi:hypothetical protein